jgi:hypothetical protein
VVGTATGVLQRERTALKVMMQLLVEHRETLKVGDIVPVGDLFDVVAHGDEAFSQDMAIHFDNAKRLYHQKLLPLLEKQHGRREAIETLTYDDPKRVALRNDDRLLKTLLLSALVPEVASLRALNAERLAALNHGTIKTPIAGREGQEVLRRCRTWAASVGEIRIGEDANPTISVQLSGVDTESIIRQAEREDNQGNRVRRVRQMIFEQTGVRGEGEFEQCYEHSWKNTKRMCTVLFRNIRELSDSSLENSGENWKLVIDFPFDEPGHGPKDDLSKLQAFKNAHPSGAKTLCWVPAFFSQDAQKDLGLLVILEHILTGERYNQYSNHLSPQDRQSARSLLENQRSILKQRVQSHLDAAYGLEALLPGSVDTTHDLELSERFVSLWPGFEPAPPVAASLAGATNHLVSQALEHEFPAAPAFEAEIKSSNLKKVLEVVSEAARSQDGRVPVEKPLRALVRSIANPLKLGEMGLDATHFVLGQHWKNHFTRKAAETGTPIEVRQLRRSIDEPKAMGLPREVQNLVILIFAQQTNRSFVLHGAPYEASLASVDNLCELREQRLPDEAHWVLAVKRAGSILGVAVSPLRNATNVAALNGNVKQRAAEARASCQGYCQKLRDRLERLGVALGASDRMTTAAATIQLLERVLQSADERVVEALASAEVATSEAAMAECFTRCGTLAGVLDGTNWEIFEAISQLTDARRTAAEEIRASVVEALRCDEHARPLGPALKEAQSKAVRLLTAIPAPPPQPVPTPPVVPPPVAPPITHPVPPVPGRMVVEKGSVSFEDLAAARTELGELAKKVTAGRKLRGTIAWQVEEEPKSR